MIDPTQRFSRRVENYIKCRPAYPPAIIDLLRAEYGLTRASIVADIGSGTGILTELFLKNGNVVYSVEPNREMREAGERLLKDYPRFRSVGARAEATTLPDHSVDLVAAGQAFHWFDREKARAEFERIVKPGGWIVLVWNERRAGGTPFLEAYEQLLVTYAIDYKAVSHKEIDPNTFERFFAPGSHRLATFSNAQYFDLDGVKGRLLSSSYAPEAGHPNRAPMLEALRRIFESYQAGGQIKFEYETQAYFGKLTRS